MSWLGHATGQNSSSHYAMHYTMAPQPMSTTTTTTTMQEDLYEEDMPKKVRATGMIAQLFRQTENFENLLSHETLLQVRPD